MQKKKITDISRYNCRRFHIELKYFFFLYSIAELKYLIIGETNIFD